MSFLCLVRTVPWLADVRYALGDRPADRLRDLLLVPRWTACETSARCRGHLTNITQVYIYTLLARHLRRWISPDSSSNP